MQTRPRSPSPAPAAPRRRSAERRGSVLLMVMGVLALLAIVAVLYAAIGQGDRRTSAALQREVRIETQARAIADYIAGIIADDAVTTVSIQDPRDPTNPDARIRSTEQFDYPSVDGSARSMSPNAAAGETLFTPAGRGTDPWLASHEPGWAALFDPATADPPPYGTPLYTTFVDWPQISNIAPNGWFVNRANLRNNFHAAPGTGTGPGTAPQTSSGLSLMTAANGAATVQTNAAALNTPALFTRNQRYAYRPAGAPNASGTPYYAPGDYRHISNQWADADGDGMLDARWTELVRWAPGPTNSTADDEYIPVIPAQGPARLLVAARIVDCSAMVNVNTATDYALTPGLAGTPPVHLPSGLTPAEVDLARLLAMSDWYDIYGGVYDEYNNAAANTAANYTNYDRDTALEAGRAGATWLRHALLGREPNDPALVYPDNNGAAPSLNPMPHAVAATPQMGKASYYLARAAAERFAMTGTEVGIARGFGLQDELELRARHGCNDASRYSALERVLGGKHTDASLDNFDPMRSNRGPEVEHAGKGWPPVGTDPSGAALPRDILAGLANPRSLLTTHSGARPLRTRLLDPSEPDDVGLGPLDVRLSAEEALRAATDPTNPSLQALYRGVADALLPYARIEASGESAWDTASATHASTRTLFYGHRGPELAARCAAHLVANLIDSFDRDDPADIEAVGEEPTRLMVLLRDGLTATTSQAFASVTDPRVLDLTAAHGNGELYLAQPGDTLLGPDAIEVIGIEAQPVVVQAAMFHIYTDTPENAGGDSDGDYDDINGNGIFDPGVDQPAASRRVSIRGDVDATNPDFLGQVLAIQVTNPFR
ncbi:MAG TPA: hypothetical protein VD963_11040, partial [Phycisphaerales bacterium]|nr:hypothetical protein [Phycisphaerales bacterium]